MKRLHSQFLSKLFNPFRGIFFFLFLTVGISAGQALLAFSVPMEDENPDPTLISPPCSGDLVGISFVYSGPGGVSIQAFRRGDGSQLLASFTGVQTGDVLTIDASTTNFGRLLGTTWLAVQDPANPCTSANGCLSPVPSGCNSYTMGRTFGAVTITGYTDQAGQTISLGLAGNGNRQVVAQPQSSGNGNGSNGNTQSLTNRTISLNTGISNGSPRRNNGQGQAKSGADLDGDGLSYNLTTEELDVNPGDGIEINSDLVEVKTSDLDGSGIEVINNNIHVNPGDGILLSNDEVTVNASDLEGAGLNAAGNNLAVNVDGSSIEIDPNDDLRIASGAAGDGLDGGSNQPLKVGDGAGIGVNANSIEVNVDGSTIDIEPFSDAVRVAPGGITNNEVAVDAIATGNIIDGSIFPRDIASGGNSKVLTTDGSGGVVWQDQSSVQTAVADGDGLVVDFTNNETDVNPGDGIAVNNDQVEVVASDLEGDGLSVSNNDLNINAGDGIAINADNVEVNAADIDGDGLTTNNNNLSINPGPGIVVFGDQVIVNTNDLDGDGLGVNSTTFQLEVNTDNSTIETDGADNLRVKAEGITANEIGTGAVTSDEILDGTIQAQDVGQNGAATNEILMWDGTTWVPTTNNDADADVSNELQTLSQTGNNVTLSQGGGTISVADNDNDPTNEYNTGATLTGNTLNITDAGGTQSVDLSVLNNTGSDDQNLTGATLTGTDLTIDIENGTSTTADLSALEESADIAQVATDLQTHITNDGDLDATNEFQDLSNTVSGTNRTIEITNGANTTIDVADNDNLPTNELQALSQTGNDITLSQGGGTISVADNDNDSGNEIQDLSTTTSGTNRTINISGGGTGTTINVADNDNDASNELQTVTQTGNNVTLSQGGGTISVADNDNDASNELQTVTQTGNNVTLSQGGGTISVADNDNDPTNEYNTGATLTGNTLNITDAGGTQSVDLSVLNNTGSDDQNLTGATLTGSDLTIDIENGTSTTADLSALEESADIAQVATDLQTHITSDGDLDATNEFQDLSNTVSGTNRTIEITNGANTTIDVADNDNLPTNELQALSQTGNDITLSQGGGTISVADNDNDSGNEIQDLSTTTSGTNRTINISGGGTGTTINVADNDNDASNELQSVTQTGNNVTLSQGGGTISVADNDNDASNELQTVTQTGNNVTLSQGGGTISVADNDNDPTNEYNTGATLTGNTLNITDAGGTQSVDLSVLNNTGSDDQNLTGATLTGTDLTIDIENGTSTTADLSALEESADIAQVATDLQTHITNDGDLDATNEFQTLSQTGNTVTLSDGGGTINVADNDNDSGNEIQDLSTTTSGTNRTINISGGGTGTTINVADNDNDASNELQTVTQSGNNVTLSNGGGTISVADNDNDPTNEYNTGATLTGNTLNITDAGGTQTVDLSSLNNTGSDDQNLTGATLAGSDLTIDIENGTSTTADLSALEESADIAQVATDLQTHITNDGDLDATNEIQDLSTTTSGTNRTINISGGGTGTTINVADNDNDASNELQTVTQSGNNVTLSNGGGTISVADNDNDASNEIQNLTLSGSQLSISGGNTVTLPPDGDSDATNEIQDLSTTTSGTNRTINITGGTGTTINVADNDNDASNEIQNLTLSGSQLSISGGNTITLPPDGDSDATNEIQTISKSGSTVTLSDGGGSFTDAVNDADANATNELQTISKSGSTVTLSNGGGSFTDAVNDADASATNELNGTLNLNGNNLELTDAGGTLSVSLASLSDADPDPTNEFQDLSSSSSGTNRTIAITNGTNATINIADNDNDVTNEIQTLVQAGNNVTLSNGGGTVSVADNDNDASNEIQNLGSTSSGTFRTVTISGGGSSTFFDIADNDNNSSNELQTISKSGSTVTLSNGGGSYTDAVNDADANATNELQTISKSGSTVTLSNGGGSYTDAVNDADASATNELQNLSISGNTISLSNGGGSVTVAGTSDNLGNHTATTSLQMADNNILDANTIQANTILDPEDGTLNINDNVSITGVLQSRGANYSSTWMQFDQDVNGNSLLLGAGGLTVLGSGESANSTRPNVAAGNETLHLTSDAGLQIYTNMQTGWGARVNALGISSGGVLSVPNLGGSGNRMVVASSTGTLSTQAIPVDTDDQDLSSSTSGTNRTINITGGSGTTINVADNDNSSSNELQSLSISGSTISLNNGGGSVTVPSTADNLGNHSATNTLNMNNNNVSGVNYVSTRNVDSYDKLRVWSSSSYAIGMNSAMTFGFLNDYATTFTMNNESDRGWVWRDASDAKSDGAMSLTTNGQLYVKGVSTFASNLGVGTTAPSGDLHVFRADNDIARVYATGSSQGSGMFYAGQSNTYGGGFGYDGDGTPAMIGGSDRITFFRRNNGTDTDVMSYGYSNSTLRISSLAGSGNRMVIANAAGDLTSQSIPVNTDNQNLSSSTSGTNRTINITGGSGTTISVADNDNSSSNELQTLSVSGQTLSLSNGGGSVTVPSGSDNLGNHVATTNLNMNGNDIDFIRGDIGQIRSVGQISFDWTSGTYDSPTYHGIRSASETGSMTDDLSINSYDDIIMRLDANNNDATAFYKVEHHSPTNGTDLFWVRSPDGYAYHAGRLGIGTTGAAYPLHVTLANNGNWQGRFTNGASNVYLAHQGGYGMHINTGGTNSSGRYALEVRNANRTHFYVRDDGRVGLGTTSPAQTFHVVGGARISSLAGSGNRMVIANANGDLSTQAIPANGDITGVTAGAGLTGGGSSGTPTINAAADNGLNVNTSADRIRLGGSLIQNTAISQGIYAMDFNLNSSGDFSIQDNGTDIFQVRDDGVGFYGDDFYWRDGSAGGRTIMYITDDGDDGRLRILENGLTSIDLDANSQFIFNEQGLDRNFRIESDADVFNFWSDAGLNRIGIGESAPKTKLHVEDAAGQSLMLSRNDGSITTNEQLGGIGFDGADGNIPDDVRESSSAIIGFAAETFSTGDKGGYLTFWTSPVNQNDDTDGLERMRVEADGDVIVANDFYVRDGATASGDMLVRAYDSSDDGVVDIYENGAYNIRLHGNGTTVFNEQSLNNDFRIESDLNSAAFFVDASANEIGMGTTAPAARLDVRPNNSNNWGIYMDHNKTSTGYTIGLNIDLDNTSSTAATNVGAFLGSYKNGAGGSVLGVYGYAQDYSTSGTHGSRGLEAYAYTSSTGGSESCYGVFANTGGVGTRYAGYFSGNVYTTGSYLPSDRKLKENVADFDGALDVLGQLKTYTYDYKTEEFKHANFPEGEQIGLIADEVKAVVPGLVTKAIQPEQHMQMEDAIDMYGTREFKTDEAGMAIVAPAMEFNAVNYAGFVPLLIQGVNEQQVQIDEQKEEIARLTEKLEAGSSTVAPVAPATGSVDQGVIQQMQDALAQQQAMIQQQQDMIQQQQTMILEMKAEMSGLQSEDVRFRELLENSAITQDLQADQLEEMLDRIYLSEQAIIELGSCCDDKGGENSLETGDNETLLFQNHPNPFNKVTTITYKLAEAGKTELVIYDDSSLPVETVVDEMQDAGIYNVEWDGSKFTSGVYIYMLKQNNVVLAKKMVLIK